MSFFRRAMVYLGLVDDDYDDYGPYEEPQAGAPSNPPPRGRVPVAEPEATQPSAIRTLPREAAPRDEGMGVVTVTPRPAVVRPLTPDKAAKVHVVEPRDFDDAKEIGDRFKAGQPVIVTLQGAPDDLRRRLVDFCSGIAYVLDGTMRQVTRGVYLLTPSNVEVSAEEKRRLEEQGLYRS